MSSRIVVWVFSLIALAPGGVCNLRSLAQAPPTIEAELSRYGVALTTESLQPALKDPRGW
jgi:hypothetical protein